MSADIAREQITGLVLAGGQGSRMGGVDKGLQAYLGMPLALNALRRLSPQVGRMMINANRNLGAYEAMGVSVHRDLQPGYPGPLAGILAGLQHCETPYLVTVPCDSPRFPEDLVERLARALRQADGEIARACTQENGRSQVQPVFCLMKATLRESLARFVGEGQRKVGRWTSQHRCMDVPFEDAAAFFNANTLTELAQVQQG